MSAAGEPARALEGEYLSPALRQPPLPDDEKRRLRELSRFVSSTNTPYYDTLHTSAFAENSTATPTPSEVDTIIPVAQLSNDITLTALTQLGVYRFGCMRSFVSLIDDENQHIISEATASISLRHSEKHAPDDGLYLGVTTLDLVFGVCPHAVKLFSGHDVPHLQNNANVTANSTRYIVRDFTREEYFKERPYVTAWPYFRFYAEVPIYSPSGHILGSYCVVDNKPRTDFAEADVVALQEVSDAIARHLENVRTVHYHRRSDRLVQGLTTFVKDRPDERTAPMSVASLRSNPPSPPRHSDLDIQPERLRLRELSMTTDPTGTTSPLFSHRGGGDYSTDATSLSVALNEGVESPPINTLGGTCSPQESVFFPAQTKAASFTSAKSTPLLAAKDSVPLSNRVANVFAHASALIKDSMDVDGVLFIDACLCNSGIVRPRTDLQDWEPLPKNADPRPRTQSPYAITQSDETACDILGLAVNEDGRYGISDALLRELIAALPQGGVLHPDENSTDPSLLETRLAAFFPQARSLLFIPLWDWNKGQWLAGTFVWTRGSEQERALGLDEVHYFKVFGDSIISEIARLDWSQKEKSKFDLISSVSHELRSPLHGMLANAELLAASTLLPDQHETVKALQTCGITLLDTMNHLLDFAKINNLTSMNQGVSSVTSLVSTFDLGNLIEEVVHSVFSGMRHASIASTPNSSPSTKEAPAYKRDLSVVLRFENQDQWRVTSMTGAWRRIVMNILGNALKYTEKGFVEVSCSLLNPRPGSDQPIAHLRFADSGKGMTEEFLRNKLFSPFSQEDALSEGAGLGLSIVKQLITFLKGSIDVKSEVNVGTQVDIYIPIQPEAAPAMPVASPEPTAPTTAFSLVGLVAYPELSEEPTGTLSPAAKRKICLQSFFANLILDQPGWRVSSAESIDQANGDIVIIDEAEYERIYEDEALRRRFEKTRFVCLCDGMPTLSTSGVAQVARLYQPFSPRKVLQVLKSALEAQPQLPPSSLSKTPAPKLSLVTDVTATPITPNLVDVDRTNSLHVLIVDDNEINIKVLSKLMSKLGYEYKTATNGLLALNKYKESPEMFKMVLMDVSMPVMDGIEATRQMRIFEQERSLPPVKIFAVTGIASAGMQQDAMMAGVDDYLVKPLSLAQLGKLIKVHL
ncbi:hypothetical protein BDV19DRAFT_368994 [Aspergillus venezuelensis]